MKKELTCCPYCGSEEFYTVQKVSGKIYYNERFDGKEAENGSLYEGLTYKSGSKYAYCTACNKRLFKLTSEGEK